MNNALKSLIIGLVKAGFPYMSVDAVSGKGNTLHTEIRVGGEKCGDGFIRSIFSLGGDMWTGHFYGIKFTANTENLCWLISNAYELAYIRHMRGKCLSDKEINYLRTAAC